VADERPVSAELETALRLRARGVRLFPANPRNKRPMQEGHGFKDATLDERTIRGWFSGENPPMIAMPTGASTGLVVLDADPPLGPESILDLERKHGRLPRTASATTPSGGSHYYFRHPGHEVPCSAGRIAPGLDLRADGGYVVLPPSRRDDGRRYTVDVAAPPAPMPGWLLELACARGRRLEGAPGAEEPGLVPSGRRHAALVSFAGSLRAMGLREAMIVECGLAYLRHQCAEDRAKPIDWGHAERSLRSVAKYPPHPNGER
jgi:hypothetical protein